MPRHCAAAALQRCCRLSTSRSWDRVERDLHASAWTRPLANEAKSPGRRGATGGPFRPEANFRMSRNNSNDFREAPARCGGFFRFYGVGTGYCAATRGASGAHTHLGTQPYTHVPVTSASGVDSSGTLTFHTIAYWRGRSPVTARHRGPRPPARLAPAPVPARTRKCIALNVSNKYNASLPRP